MSVLAGASVSPFPSGPGAGFQVIRQANDTEEYVSSGPAQSGNIQLNVVTENFRELSPTASQVVISDGVHQYLYNSALMSSTPGMCSYPGICYFQATLPFDLGTTFSVIAVPEASTSDLFFLGAAASAIALLLLRVSPPRSQFAVTEDLDRSS